MVCLIWLCGITLYIVKLTSGRVLVKLIKMPLCICPSDIFLFLTKKCALLLKKLIYIFLGKILKKCHKLTLCLTVLRIVTELLEVARTFPGQILFLTVTVATTHSTCMCNRISWRYNSRFEHSFGRLESYTSILDQFWRYSKRIHPI